MLRSSLNRSGSKVPRLRKCAVATCRAEFKPMQSFIKWCSPECGHAIAVAKLAKQKTAQARAARVAARADRAETKKKLEKFKRKPRWIAEVQDIFNQIVRLEDRDLPCISCNKFVVDDGRPGGVWDAGHYLARGGSGHLRFDRRNVHKQCKGCNRPGGTARAAFRAGMEKRIGLAALEALEADQEARHYTIDELKQMKTELAAKLRALKEKA
jgi:hypothetical protein